MIIHKIKLGKIIERFPVLYNGDKDNNLNSIVIRMFPIPFPKKNLYHTCKPLPAS